MSGKVDATHAQTLPRGILIAAAILVAFALAAAATARVTGIGTVSLAPTKPVATLSLRFEDEANGGIAVRDARDNRLIHEVAPETNGFIRGTMRGMARERRLAGIGPDAPFVLTRWNDGTLSLDDATTARHIGLDAFGPDNAGAFAQLFAAAERAR